MIYSFKLLFESERNAEDIDVKVEKGNVTLEGAVKTLNEKRAAYESAIYTPGVVAVDNKIVVG